MLLGSFRLQALTSCRTRRAVQCFATAPADTHKLNVNKCVMKAHEGKSFSELIKLPPGALQGLKEDKANEMLAAFNIKSIEDLGRWKHYQAAKAISVLAATEEAGKRPEGAASNINALVDKAFEASSLTDLLEAPPSALQGLAPWTDNTLQQLGIKTIADLAKWKYAARAEALTTLASYERADFGSR